MDSPSRLPIEDCLDELKRRLSEYNNVVLEAPPGAGKTTLVPLALLDQQWLGERKIIMLEPRRIAARSAAYRLAELLGESPGQTVGYRMRLESRIGPHTRIEVITEGILTRMLQQDPALEDVGLVIFDEFHERSLDSDLALALTLKGRELFADDSSQLLKILVMSATLDSQAVAQLLDDAPVVRSEGRSFPVDLVYGKASEPKERIDDRVVKTLQRALNDHPESSILTFLPGQGEIRRIAESLDQWLRQQRLNDIHLFPLYGNLSLDEQKQAIAPLPESNRGERKVVLATNIAETSLTIEGVDIVVDSGLVREPRFNPSTGMTGLQTRRISKASSTQRAGRAGRLRPGHCYRLWSESQQQQLAKHGDAEILHADLAPLAMQLLQWGEDDPTQLSWLDPPPRGHWRQAIDLLDSLGALDKRTNSRVLNTHGEQLAALPVHPRLAQLLVCAAESGLIQQGALLASLLTERNPLAQDNPDLSQHVDVLSGQSRCPSRHQGWLHRCRKLAEQFEQQVRKLKIPRKMSQSIPDDQITGFLVACAYPDRIGRQRHSGGYQLANGRSASFAGEPYLSKQRWIAVAEVSGLHGGQGDVIRSASHLDEALFDTGLSDRIRQDTIAEWDKKSGRFIAEQQHRISELVVQREKLDKVPEQARLSALTGMIHNEGLKVLSWTSEIEQWRARVTLLRNTLDQADWPDVSDERLLDTLEDWLGPYLAQVNSLQALKKLKLEPILHAMLPWDKQQQLDHLAPLRIKAPSGSSIRIDYSETPPVMAVKLQEMFGCEDTPRIANDRINLMIHLLSPAGRPLQITQDLAGFWRSSYHDVKKDMKGRYPKHPWPDDPIQALPTRKTKRHLKD